VECRESDISQEGKKRNVLSLPPKKIKIEGRAR
jgi:hypothetical protein